MPAATIIRALKQQLQQYLPFSAMTPEDVSFVVINAEVAYYAPGETVIAPSHGVPPHCVIVKQGTVQAVNPETGRVALDASIGDCFPVGALLAERPVSLTYNAVGDTFCLLLPRVKFDELTRRSPVFLDFCRRRLGVLLDKSRLELQQRYATEASAMRTMSTPLAELARQPALTCTPDTPLHDALKLMHDANVGSIIVVEPASGGESVVGILTRSDLIRSVILPMIELATPIKNVMSRNVRTLPTDASAADASLMMAEHSIRHIPIVDEGVPRRSVIGVVSERDLFTLQRLGIRQMSTAIEHADNVSALASIAADIRALSHHLVAQGVSVSHLTRLISRLNDQLTIKLLTLTTAERAISPDSFCWLSFGSEGRREQTIASDQDNGILFDSSRVTRERVLQLAEHANEALAACGFPLCTGNIMARNPQWCLTFAEWQLNFSTWIDSGDPSALLNASIFFDFRPLFGAEAQANQLRDFVISKAQNQRFLKQMADNALMNPPPTIGGLIESLFPDSGLESVDLKMSGTALFVAAARIWAYSVGLKQTNTTERLTQLAAVGRLHGADVLGWIAAFEFFQLMRLREQHRRVRDDVRNGNPNVVRLANLSVLDRRVINEAFRQARKLQQRLQLDFPG